MAPAISAAKEPAGMSSLAALCDVLGEGALAEAEARLPVLVALRLAAELPLDSEAAGVLEATGPVWVRVLYQD